MYDLKGVFNDADSEQFLAVVAAVHHEGVGEALHDGALGLTEPLGGVATSGVRQVAGMGFLDSNVVLGGGGRS